MPKSPKHVPFCVQLRWSQCFNAPSTHLRSFQQQQQQHFPGSAQIRVLEPAQCSQRCRVAKVSLLDLTLVLLKFFFPQRKVPVLFSLSQPSSDIFLTHRRITWDSLTEQRQLSSVCNVDIFANCDVWQWG